MRDFKTLNIWKDGIKIVKCVYEISNQLPTEEKFGLKSQICRSAVSIPSNIAEGCSRSSQTDFKRFLEIALGSSFELETQLFIMKELEFSSPIEIDRVFQRLNKLQKMINNLIQKLKADS